MEGEREAFLRRYIGVFRRIRSEHPGFWRELGDYGRQFQGSRFTTSGAVVLDWPEMKDVAAQTGPIGGPLGRGRGRRTEERAAQTAPGPGRQTRATQTDPILALGPVLERWLEMGRRTPTPAPRPTPAAPPTPAPRPTPAARSTPASSPAAAPRPAPTSHAPGCWNCGARTHRYSSCPQPRDRPFCYGCGREDVTLRECPRCREMWREDLVRRSGDDFP